MSEPTKKQLETIALDAMRFAAQASHEAFDEAQELLTTAASNNALLRAILNQQLVTNQLIGAQIAMQITKEM